MKTILKTLPFILALFLALSVTSCKKDILGCTDPSSENYNPEATVDAGDCKYRGCTDPQSETYDPKANVDDGSCEYKGCTDSKSINYNPKATIDDGSCEYERDQFIGMYNGSENCDSGTYTWVMEIKEGTSNDVAKVLIKNLGDFDLEFTGVIDGNKITFSYNQAGISIEGSGTLNGNTLNATYHASVPSFDFEDDCVVVCTKQ